MKYTRSFFLPYCVLLSLTATAQYSKYYFYDTLKDDGVQTQEHLENLGKIFMDPYPDYTSVVDSSGVHVVSMGAYVTAHVYLKRSLRYYYTLYSLDTTCKSSDWDFTRYQPDVKLPDHFVGNPRFGFWVCVLVCDGDTVSTWRQISIGDKFHKQTAFDVPLWQRDYVTMTGNEYYYPLFEYVRKNKLTGIHEISMFVYPGKLTCNRVADRGPELLVTGKFKLKITEGELKEMMLVKGKTKKLEFPVYESGNNVIKLEKRK